MIARLRNLLLRDLPLKLFSLALAVLIYCTIYFTSIKNEVSAYQGPSLPPLAMSVDVRTFFNLPVLIVSSAADVHDFKVAPETVAVSVQGDARLLARLGSGDIRAWVDLTGVQSATGLRVRIQVSTPPGVTHVKVVPSEVRVIFPKDH
jgi:YbbR domain-containing protein